MSGRVNVEATEGLVVRMVVGDARDGLSSSGGP